MVIILKNHSIDQAPLFSN